MKSLILTLATWGTGLVAGLHFAFAVAVMPALHGASDRTLVDVMQRINVSIVNPVFLLVFLGSPVLLAITTIQSTERRWWLVATGLTVLGLLITFTINIPLNNRLAPADLSDAAKARDAFETLWNVAHVARTLAMSCSLVACVIAIRAGSTVS